MVSSAVILILIINSAAEVQWDYSQSQVKNKSGDATTLTPMYLEIAYKFEIVVSADTSDCIIFLNIDPIIIVCSLTLLFYKFILFYSDEFEHGLLLQID